MREENIEGRDYVHAFGVMYTKVEMQIFWKESSDNSLRRCEWFWKAKMFGRKGRMEYRGTIGGRYTKAELKVFWNNYKTGISTLT